MQETVNSAMRTLSEAVGEDVPTFDQVRDKIEARYAKAKATAELTEGNIEAQVYEVEKAARKVEAQSRLEAIRANLGIEAPDAAEAIPETTSNPDSP